MSDQAEAGEHAESPSGQDSHAYIDFPDRMSVSLLCIRATVFVVLSLLAWIIGTQIPFIVVAGIVALGYEMGLNDGFDGRRFWRDVSLHQSKTSTAKLICALALLVGLSISAEGSISAMACALWIAAYVTGLCLSGLIAGFMSGSNGSRSNARRRR